MFLSCTGMQEQLDSFWKVIFLELYLYYCPNKHITYYYMLNIIINTKI